MIGLSRIHSFLSFKSISRYHYWHQIILLEATMPKKRIVMTKINEVLRLKFDCQLSNRNIATCVKIGFSTVSEILSRFKLSELGWPLPDGTSDQPSLFNVFK